MLLTGGVPVTSQGNIDFDKVFDWHASQMCTIVNTVSEGLAVIVVITVIASGASRPNSYDGCRIVSLHVQNALYSVPSLTAIV